jgi:peptide/nickel transport system substrate-binding protein
VTDLELNVDFANVTWYGVSQQSLWEKLKSDFAAVGITVNIRPVEYENWIEGYRAGKFSITSGLWAPEDFDSSSYFDPFGREEGIYGVRTSMDFPIGQKLYEQYLAEKDPAAREQIAVHLITEMRDDATLIPVFQAKKLLVHSDAVTGVRYSPNKQIRLADIKPN